MNLTLTLTALVDLLANGLTNLWHGASLLLISAPFAPSQNLVLADVTEATFTGYARKAVILGSSGWNPAIGAAEAVGTGTYQWFGPSDSSGQLIYGYALYQPGAAGPPVVPATILFSSLFPGELPLQLPTDTIALAVAVAAAGSGTGTLLA